MVKALAHWSLVHLGLLRRHVELVLRAHEVSGGLINLTTSMKLLLSMFLCRTDAAPSAGYQQTSTFDI